MCIYLLVWHARAVTFRYFDTRVRTIRYVPHTSVLGLKFSRSFVKKDVDQIINRDSRDAGEPRGAARDRLIETSYSPANRAFLGVKKVKVMRRCRAQDRTLDITHFSRRSSLLNKHSSTHFPSILFSLPSNMNATCAIVTPF